MSQKPLNIPSLKRLGRRPHSRTASKAEEVIEMISIRRVNDRTSEALAEGARKPPSQTPPWDPLGVYPPRCEVSVSRDAANTVSAGALERSGPRGSRRSKVARAIDLSDVPANEA